MTFLFKVLENLPLPPENLLAKIDLDQRPENSDLAHYTQRWLTNWPFPAAYRSGTNVRMKCPELEEWVRTHIWHDIKDAGINYTTVGPTDQVPMSSGGHTDKTRNYILLYPLVMGGDDTRTVFWQEDGHPLIRPLGVDVEDGSKLIMQDWITLPQDRWTMLNVGVVHSLENLYSTRITLQVSLAYNPWEDRLADLPGRISFIKENHDEIVV
jgi:hypothetical protein